MSIVLALCMSFSMALGAVAFAENGEKTVLSIQISKQPDKLIYFDGQTITLNGIELIINYSDGTSRSVTTDEIIADRLSYDVTHTTMSFDGVNSPVQIEYGSVLSEPLNIIIIKDVQYVKISDASRANLKNAYIVGENFDLSGMQLEVKWKVKDTKTQNVTETVEIIPREQFSSIGISVTPQHGAKLTAGTHDLIAAYPGSNTVELEFPITFTDVSTLSVTEQPVKTAYKYGETLDLTGLQVRLDLLNGSTKVVDFSEFDKYGITVFPAHGTVLTHATNQIMITHGQISIEHNITVTPVVTGILYGSAVWVYYDRANPTLNLSKLNVKLTKSDGSTQTVPFSEFESHGITTEPAHGTPLPEPKYGKAYQLEVAYPVPGGSSLRYTGNVYAFQKAVQNIRVKTEPSQIANPAKSIEQKDVLDLSGLEVELIWNDGSPNTTVNLAQFNDYGLTVSPADGTLLNTIGTNTVTVSHTYTKDGTSETETAKDSFTFPVQGVTSLEWYAEPAKKEYTAGEVLDMSDAQVILRWSDSREITKDFPPVSYANFGGNFLTVSPNPATGLTKGHTMVTITHTLSGETLQYPIAVYAPATGVSVSPKTIALYSNASPQTAKLTASVAPDEAKQAVTWTSSDPAVATVDTDGNVTAVSNGTATITATSQDGTFTDTCAVTVTAYSDSTGGVIIGGGTPAQPEPKEEESQHLPEQPNTPAVGEGKVKGTVDSKGNATVKITPKSVVDAYEKAMAEAKKNGSEKNGVTVVLRVDTGKKTAGNVSFNLPKTVQDAIIERQIVNFVLMMDDGDISVGIDLNAMKEITKQAKGDVTITATRTNSSKLGSAAKKAIGNRPVYSFKVTYGGGRQVQNFGSGKVTVAIPYALGENQNAGNVQAVYVDAKGKTRYLVRSVFDSARKVLLFSTDTFSTFGVGYRQTNAYEDVADHWAEDDIAFAVSRGLMTGKSKTAFGPDASITRATLVAALGRLADVDVSGYKKSSFGDVKNRSSYMAYIEWAVENGIAQGGGKGKFVPNGTVSREQLAVMLHRYAEAIGFALPKVYEERAFADGEKISEEAAEAVRLLQMAGVISGKSGNLFDPKAKATKAEVAAVLRRFAELLISEEGTQGWTKNDSGQWMYRENGRFVTGEREIDGTTYFFDVYGITER